MSGPLPTISTSATTGTWSAGLIGCIISMNSPSAESDRSTLHHQMAQMLRQRRNGRERLPNDSWPWPWRPNLPEAQVSGLLARYEWLFSEEPYISPFTDMYKLSPDHQRRIHQITQTIFFATKRDINQCLACSRIKKLSTGIHPTALAISLVETVRHGVFLSRKDRDRRRLPWFEELGEGYREVLRYVGNQTERSFRTATKKGYLTLGILVFFAPFVIENLGFKEDGITPGGRPAPETALLLPYAPGKFWEAT
ncbi:hypothetical protein CC80DRAFT_588321 [Byssothecium circinans]|uniref:Uncharacterized protein n=1 Tax=Byssothecium circinans TaxID=147558 RepID=A0A6A5UGD1_9PLEO|nr:hypothetical protein CC80DRAFT_588321 [Byssothecium circinans]